MRAAVREESVVEGVVGGGLRWQGVGLAGGSRGGGWGSGTTCEVYKQLRRHLETALQTSFLLNKKLNAHGNKQ
jgi:hypothetical protein